MSTRATTGIRARHGRACATATDPAARCTCRPSWEASVYLKREGRKIRKTFATKAEAKGWRSDTASAAGKGKVHSPSATTVAQAWQAFYEGALSGAITSRKRERYRPSALRSYEAGMRLRVLPALGHVKLSELRRRDVQNLADVLTADGWRPSTVANALDPLRRVCARAVRDDVIVANPCDGVELEARDGRRERIAAPDEARALLAALPETDRGLWATAFYAGLRRGELRALRVSDVDLTAGVIHVARTWDDVAGEQAGGKSKAATRTVPIFDVLRPHLLAHLLAHGRRGDDLLFGVTATTAFDPSSIRLRSRAAWGWRHERAHGWVPNGTPSPPLAPITLHECRHTAVSIMVASGADRATLIGWVGHADLKMLDHYTHSFVARQARAVADVNAYLHAVGDPGRVIG